MHRRTTFLLVILSTFPLAPRLAGQASDAPAYFPPRGTWATAVPEDVGMDSARLARAVEVARAEEAPTLTDLRAFIASTLANEPHGEIIGPVRDRGATNGVIIRRGHVVAEWGPTERVDMTFSVTKTYLSTVVGLAVDRGWIRVQDPVRGVVPDEPFATERDARITWDHLLRQTSDWRGTLWGKPDWADRPPRGASLEEMQRIPLREPGSAWEYNDVRVNLLALCATHVWCEPLPVVLRREVMDPIGASRTWRWHGYESSWIELDGQRIQVPSGGGHWGGGLWISTRDHARFGYLILRRGRWGDRRLLSEAWIEAARTPTEANPGYGYMNWFLNGERTTRGTPRKPMPSAPASSVTFQGAGSNVIYVDWENDLVIVARWIRSMDAIVGATLAALR